MKEIMLVLHFVGLAMGLGTSFAFMFVGIASSKMDREDARKFRANAMIISRMGHIGITLLIISGAYLMTPYWSGLADMPTLIAKLVLVLLLVLFVVLIGLTAKKIKQTQDEKYEKQIGLFGRLSLLTAITIVVLAVYTFH